MSEYQKNGLPATGWHLIGDVQQVHTTNLSSIPEQELIDAGITLVTPVAPTQAEQVEQAKRLKIDSLSLACATTIYSGFSSPALGTAHHYPASDIDQLNLTGSIVESVYLPPTKQRTPPHLFVRTASVCGGTECTPPRRYSRSGGTSRPTKLHRYLRTKLWPIKSMRSTRQTVRPRVPQRPSPPSKRWSGRATWEDIWHSWQSGSCARLACC